jgi:hypothetical protein
MSEEPTQKVAAWATEVALQAAQLPTARARSAYLADRHRELLAGAREQGMGEADAKILADTCVQGAQRIMKGLLARGGPVSGWTGTRRAKSALRKQ